MEQRSAAIATMSIALVLPLVASPQPGTLSATDILKAVERNSHQLHSGRIQGVELDSMTADFYKLNQEPGQSNKTRLDVVWAFKGGSEGEKRFKKYVFKLPTTGHKVTHETTSVTRTEIFNGHEQYTLLTSKLTRLKDEQVEGTIDHFNGTDMLPLKFGYQIEGQWLADILRSGRYNLAGSMSDPQFGLLYQFAGIYTQGQVQEQVRFWLAQKYGFLAVRSELEATVANRHTLTTHRLERAEQRGSIWFPTAGTMQYPEIEGGKQILLAETKVVVHRFDLNTVPDSQFEPRLKPGTYMKDGATNAYWKVGTHGEKIFINIRNKDRSRALSFGWLFIVSLTSLLFLGMRTLWRHRRNTLPS